MFASKTVVITGAASGIGRALSLHLARAGANVWAVDVDAAALAALADDASKFGQLITTRVADVTDEEALRQTRDSAVAAHKTLDYWINNAGIAGLGEFTEMGSADFNRVLDVNVRAVVHGTRLALETMEAAGFGNIVNMASIAGHLPAPFMTAYCTSKHAVVGFTRALQAELELKVSPIKLMLVSPGFVDTRILGRGADEGGAKSKFAFPDWLAFTLATPESVATAVVRGMLNGRREIYPTLNGKFMKKMYGVMPKATVRSSRLLLTRSWKDLLTNHLVK